MVVKTLLRFRWPRGLDKLEYLTNYGRAVKGFVGGRQSEDISLCVFRSFYRDLRVRHSSCKSPLIM